MTTNERDGARFLAWIRERMESFGLPDAVRVRPVEVSGARVHVRTLAAEHWAALYRFEEANPDDLIGRAVKLISFGVCDADGAPLLTPDAVLRLPERAAVALADHVAELNGLNTLRQATG